MPTYEWVAVSERMPEWPMYCWLNTRYGIILGEARGPADRRLPCDEFRSMSGQTFRPDEVTHWQRIDVPQAPGV